ncbi:MAG: hypothetical protein PWQ17_2514 [Anaerophaga sp.]|uniref:nucleotidyl transferase AbiEii/AbiGii toxin family protein n=1 Tax=Anaerophaga thermohalophila TaxID=177400 RepID=UPI000237CACC|nr:nucleotidyl transferase AbiEii/AbiGii toxin family protein [Anaerophaga thermohalophila]MDI3521391.1 hypothetical protein [Anaerophaga sp.]MDK2843008.1 hypothetical protein [Anaerophaga sp.]MDN5290813.1 hypothetical protein [Anaerophaga sp.]
MIKQKEIVDIANIKSVPKTTIDKDWVLGHFLNALYSFKDISRLFVFKGGTCLHKCYIQDYRFSEDLDFTLLDKEFVINESFIKKIMKKAGEQSSIKFYLAGFQNQYSNDVPQGYKSKIKFWGADHNPNQRPLPSSRWQNSIQIDISFSESLLLPPVEKDIFHPYSDKNIVSRKANCYDLRELFSEKIRALKQRNRPRDVYDVWFLSNTNMLNGTWPELKSLLIKKSELKGLKINGVEDFVNKEKALRNKRAWKQSLAHQIKMHDLPEFDDIYKELSQFINHLLK